MPSKSPPAQPATRGERIAKLLARAGVASRREIERMIADGRVAREGMAIDTPATLLTSLHGVTVDGHPVAAPAPARLFVYHKPTGLLVTERDPGGRPTIYDRLPKSLPRVVPVGRLDLNTEGLLLLTTDGGLKRQLELPATGVERSYRARAYGSVTQDQLEELIHGVEIEGVRYGPIDANLERRTGANTWIEMTLTEGKNREVRRVLEHLGLRVSRLIRVRYGPFVLADLPVGEVGEVRQHDLVAFRRTLDRHTRTPLDPIAVASSRASASVTSPKEAEAPGHRPPSAPKARPRGAPSSERTTRPRRAEEAGVIAKPQRAARAAAHRRSRGDAERSDPPREQAPRGAKPTRPAIGTPREGSPPSAPRRPGSRPRRPTDKPPRGPRAR